MSEFVGLHRHFVAFPRSEGVKLSDETELAISFRYLENILPILLHISSIVKMS